MNQSILRLGCCAAALLGTASAANLHEPDYDTIVVTASPLSKNAEALATPVSVLDDEELRRAAAASLGDTLRREPGISSTGFGPGAGRPIIRGLGGDRIRTLVNGLDSFDAASASPDHGTPIEPLLAERVEIVRGSGLLRYGSSAAGGVVNVLDGRMPRVVPEGGFDGAIQGGASTVDDGYELSGVGQVHLGKVGGLDLVVTGSGSLREAEDYDIPGMAESAAFMAAEEEGHEGEEHGEHEEEGPEGTLENSFVDTSSVSAGFSLIGDEGFFGFSVQNYETTYGIPAGHGHHGHGGEEHEEEGHEGEEHEGEEHGHDEHGEERGVFIDLEQTRFDMNARLPLGGPVQYLDFYAGYGDYTHTEFEAPGEPGTVFDNESVEFRAEAIHPASGNWRGATGLQYRYRDFSAVGEEAFIAPTETDQVGVYTFHELTVGKAVAEGSLRYESTEHDVTGTGIGESFGAFSASAGLSYAPTGNVRLTANLYRTERAPTTEELYADGPHLATQSFDIGNAALDIETALGIEGGLHLGGDERHISFNAFYTDFSDFIYQSFDGQTGADILLARGEDDPEELEEFGELNVLRYTAADAVFKGFEIEARSDLGEFGGVSFSGDVVVDYVDATLSDAPDGLDNLPRIPPLGVVAGVEASYRLASFRAELDHAAEVDDTSPLELPTDSFSIVNLYADLPIRENIVLSVAALNVNDEEARLHTSFLKDEVPLPGRNFRFNLRIDY